MEEWHPTSCSCSCRLTFSVFLLVRYPLIPYCFFTHVQSCGSLSTCHLPYWIVPLASLDLEITQVCHARRDNWGDMSKDRSDHSWSFTRPDRNFVTSWTRDVLQGWFTIYLKIIDLCYVFSSDQQFRPSVIRKVFLGKEERNVTEPLCTGAFLLSSHSDSQTDAIWDRISHFCKKLFPPLLFYSLQQEGLRYKTKAEVREMSMHLIRD